MEEILFEERHGERERDRHRPLAGEPRNSEGGTDSTQKGALR